MARADAVTALILAGGRSQRMGTDKALLSWQGRPLLRRVYDVAENCCSTVCVVTPWPERYQHLLPDTVRWQRESSMGLGPLMALAQGLNELTTPWALLLACDMPQLDGAVLQRWIQHLPSVETAAIAYVPYHQNRWEPLCGLYPKTVQSALQTFIVAGGHAFQPWLDVITVVPLAVDDAIASMLWNCNTPEDLTEGG